MKRLALILGLTLLAALSASALAEAQQGIRVIGEGTTTIFYLFLTYLLINTTLTTYKINTFDVMRLDNRLNNLVYTYRSSQII